MELKNEAKKIFGECAGIYKLSYSVNEKPSWVFADYAIWYNPKSKQHKSGVWSIGPLTSLGTGYCWIYAQYMSDIPFDEDNEWKYIESGIWVTSRFNDVSVQKITNQEGTKLYGAIFILRKGVLRLF